MFTLEQIDEIHERLGAADTLAAYVRALAALGIVRYDSYVSDGRTEYLGQDGHRVASPAAHDGLTIDDTSNREAFLRHLKDHEERTTSYVEMSEGLAASGVERWSVDTEAMTMTFSNPAGEVLLVDQIV